MSDNRVDRTYEIAKAVSVLLAEMGCRSMVIGAAALAVHGYARQSVDLDLATYQNPFENLQTIRDRLVSSGYNAELITPDAEDPLGGVINITGPDFDPVQIINFLNPLNPRPVHQLIGEALAEFKNDPAELSIVSAELLIVLKLYAGDPQSITDIRKLLAANTKIDRTRIRELCQRSGFEEQWKQASN